MMGILERLALRHRDAVFIIECNTGSAWKGCLRLDAWVMLKSWSPFTTIGYEIKNTRGDFLRDRKFEEYRDYCHELYFACPANLIQRDELPVDIGLLWTSGDQRLITKRRAVRREPPADRLLRLLSYALMSRSRIVDDMHAANREPAVDRWRRWLIDRDGEKLIGHMCARRVAQLLAETRRERDQAEAREQRFQGIAEWLVGLGYHQNQQVTASELRARFENQGVLAAGRKLARLAKDLQQLATELVKDESR